MTDIEQLLPAESWFREWMALWPTTESPKSFILFSGLSVMGAALGRRVEFDHDVHTVYPMLNVLLIGPSGTGKSTSAALGFRLLMQSLAREECPQIISGAPTPEKLHEDLRANPHAILFASELAAFFTKQKYMEGTIPYVTELLDYRDTQERRTKSGGIVIVEKPSVTVIGCSTIDWLQDQLPDSATSGGFLARFLIINEDHKSQSVPLPGRMLDRKARIALEDRRLKAFARFGYLVSQASGQMEFENFGVDDVYAEWYNGHKPAQGHLAPFAARAGEFVLRLSIILATSCGRSVIQKEDIASAIKLYEVSERKLQQVVVPMTVQGKMLAKVLDAVGADHVSPQTIRRAMRNFCSSQDTDKYVQSLIDSEDLKRDVNGELVRTRKT